MLYTASRLVLCVGKIYQYSCIKNYTSGSGLAFLFFPPVQCSNQGDIITILNRCTFAFEIKNKTPTTENKLYEKYCTNDTSQGGIYYVYLCGIFYFFYTAHLDISSFFQLILF